MSVLFEVAPEGVADPFDDTPEAVREDLEIRSGRGWVANRKERTCELVGKPPKAKKVDFSPMQRRWFEAGGYLFARVEHANPWGAVTVDLWGFADWLAVKPGEILLVQTCRASDASTRERKARSKPELLAWLAAGGRYQIHGWRQPDGPGTRWECVVREVDA
jgi:hypothetical protein